MNGNGFIKVSDLTLNYDTIWQDAKEILKDKIPDSSFLPWISPIEVVKENEEHFKKDYFILKSDQSFGVSYLNQKHFNEIQNAINTAAGTNIPVNIIFVPSNVKKAPKEKRKTKRNERKKRRASNESI